ncbi:putative bifunctional diguanylate cyclase/phosphodiesterase [Aestuariibacter sp. A3R04]|uniref:putative bifunctional diguanylate cyclase/phosphodiesterase n=1 Tax=Aestuariibacter sp. A3R04 TaxID=2841571 RepID=UPI00352DF5A2
MSEHGESKEVSSLKRRLNREKQARLQAESLLTEKSEALFRALQESQSTEKRLKLALWAAQETLWEWDASSDRISIRAFSLHDVKETIIESDPFSLLTYIHEDDIHYLQFQWALVLHCEQEHLEVSFRYRHKAEYLWMRLRGRVLERNAFGSATRIVGTTRDITLEREAEQSFHLMASAFASSREPMLVLSAGFTVTECNNAFLSMLNLREKSECFGWPLSMLLADADEHTDRLNEHPIRFETRLKVTSKKQLTVDVSLAKFETRYQKKPYIIATIRDVSERKLNETRLKQMALYDPLTGLFNRNGLNDVLKHYLQGNSDFSLLFVDLDGFKLINDGAGHESGDRCLKEVAKVMEVAPAINKVVTRWGGDEFIIILPGSKPETAVNFAHAIITAIEGLTLETQDSDLALSASIGIASYPYHGTTAERLIQNADAAMYLAKGRGKGQISVYEDGLWESVKAKVSLLSDLRKAINQEALEFYVQGKYDLHGVLKGGELLCRWHSSLHGNVPPDVFIPLAEENKLDFHIGLLSLHRACEYLKELDAERELVQLAVNISVNQLLDPLFPSQAAAICREHNISPALIEVELTESIFIQDAERAIEALSLLRNKGFSLAMDDFGSGFSALSYLRMFSFTTVKLDRSLLKDIHYDQKALALFQGIIAMLKRLEIQTVAEGVELSEYLPILRDAGVDLLQGYYFDKPSPFREFLIKLPTRVYD